MKNSKIEWTDHTFNPWWGCVNVSPARDHCYAERLAGRKNRTREELWAKDAHRQMQSDDYWNQPRNWHRKAERTGTRPRVFCGSMWVSWSAALTSMLRDSAI